MLRQITMLIITTASFFTFSNLQAQSFGTKFACCKASTDSSLGGGGCNSVERTLKDRALTQVDAGARCLALGSSMVWATHSCPKSSASCGVTFPKPKYYSFIFQNNCNKEMKVLTKDRRGIDTEWKVRGYFYLQPGQRVNLVPNANIHSISYWAEGTDGWDTIENEPYTASGRARKPLEHDGNLHYMLYATPPQGRFTHTVNLNCD